MAIGPRTGQKVFTLHAVPAQPHQASRQGIAYYTGFSLHAGIDIEAHARTKLERLTRYVSRHAVAVERLKHVRMTWAQRLKRVFAIDIECCRRCGGQLKVIASIEQPALIEHILDSAANTASLKTLSSRRWSGCSRRQSAAGSKGYFWCTLERRAESELRSW